MNYRTIATVCSLFLLSFCWAQKKEINQAKAYLKSGKDLEKAEQLMTDLLKQPQHRYNLKVYSVWYQTVVAQYEAANTKLYLGQKYDTTLFFSTVRRMFQVAEALDSVDQLPDKKGRARLEYRRRNAEQLNILRPNLYFGGTYQMRHGQLEDAYSFFDTYMDTARQPLFLGYDYAATDTLMAQAAYWAVTCAYRLQHPDSVLCHSQLAMQVPQRKAVVLQYVCEAYHWQHQDSAYIATLQQGFEEFPENPYFFPRLADLLTRQNRQKDVLRLANYGLDVNADNQLFLLARSAALFNLERYDDCMETSERLLVLNDSMPEPYYYLATIRLNKALEIEQENEPRKNRERLHDLYRQAQPYMEDYRRLKPEERRTWAPALYRIYLNLNLGRQFDEIDQLMRQGVE